MPEDQLEPTRTPSVTEPVVRAHSRCFLVLAGSDRGPRVLAFRRDHILIGRLTDNHLVLQHGSVSRRHARLSVTQQGAVLEDLDSQNGTRLNGVLLEKETSLRPGDQILAGHVPLMYFGFVVEGQTLLPEIIEREVTIIPAPHL